LLKRLRCEAVFPFIPALLACTACTACKAVRRRTGQSCAIAWALPAERLKMQKLCYNQFMKRILLVIFLILGLCHGFWHADGELYLCRLGVGEISIGEASHAGATLGAPRTSRDVSVFLTGNRQQFNFIASQEIDPLPAPSIAWYASAPGQNRRADQARHPDEWGLTVLRLPRSDG